MSWNPETRRRKILTFLQENGGSCSEEEWGKFDENHEPEIHWTLYMVVDWIPSNWIVHDQVKKRYSLTKDGETELQFLEGSNDGKPN
jgi:hypothetical protein